MVTLSLNDLVSGFPRMPVTVKPSMRPLYVCLRLKFGSRSMAAEQATPKKSFCATERASSKASMGAESRPGPEPARAARQTAPERQRARLRRPKKMANRAAAVCPIHAVKGEEHGNEEDSKSMGAGVCVCVSEPEMRFFWKFERE